MPALVNPDRYDYARLASEPGGRFITKGLLDGVQGFGVSGYATAIRLSGTARLVRPVAQSPIVYSCVRVNADAFATIPRIVWAGRDDDAVEAPETDPLVLLLGKPNPLMGGQKFQWAISRALDLDGGVFLFLARRGLKPIVPGEMPDEIWPVRDSLVQPEEMDGPFTGAWSFYIRDKKYVFPADSVARIYTPDDHNQLAAFAPSHAAWRAADHLFRAEAFDDALVENGGQMAGVFTHEERRIPEEKRDSLSKSIAQNANSPKNDRKTPILPAGLKFTPIAFSPVDMQAKDMRKDKRHEIATIYGVPPAMLGELEDANRSSLQALRRVYYENTVTPRVAFVEEELATQLLPLLPAKYRDWWIQFDVAKTSAMREDMDAQIERVEKLGKMGVSFQDAATIVELDHEPIEGEDERWISTSLQPVELALDPPEPTVVAPPGEEKTKSAHSRRRRVAHEFEEQLSKHDDAIARATVRVFRDYMLAQRKKIRAIAGRKDGEPSVVRPWNWFTESSTWSASRKGYAELLDMVPERDWVENVRGASEDEIVRLLLGEEQKWGEELWGAVEKPIKAAVLDAAKAEALALDKVAIRSTNLRVARHMAMKRVQLVEGPMSVVAERVRSVLIKALASSSSVGALADRVREALESIESQLAIMRDQLGTRAMMIARTESASAANAGRVAQFKESGIGSIEWVSAGDDLVRDGHRIDGEVQIVGQKFSNGLSEPGEAGAPAAMVINCRCTVAPVTET